MKQLESKQKQTIAFNPLIPHRPFPAMSFTHLADWFLSSASRQSLLAVRLFVFLSICESFPNTGWFNSSVWAGGVPLERRRTGDDTDSTTPAVYKPDLWGPKLIELCQQVRSGLFMYLIWYIMIYHVNVQVSQQRSCEPQTGSFPHGHYHFCFPETTLFSGVQAEYQ